MREVADPTTGEWIAAGTAAGLAAAVLALLLVWVPLRRSTATRWGRAAGFLLAAVASSLVVTVAVVVGIALDGDSGVSGPFGAVVARINAQTAERVAGYIAALLLPVAAVVAVLALAVVDVGRNTGLRIAAGVAAGVLLATGVVVALGDTGTAPTAAGWVIAVLAGGAAVALALDEVTAGRDRAEHR